jgi:hypothetical protein
MPRKRHTPVTESKDLVHPTQTGFRERLTAKKLPQDVFLFNCPECANVHFRHAGYVGIVLPFIRPGNEKRIAKDDTQVMVCTKCKHSFIWVNEQMYDISDKIDLEAWQETEIELQRATGPGGQC